METGQHTAGQEAHTEAEGPVLRRLDQRVVDVWRLGWLLRTLIFSGAAALGTTWLELPLSGPALVGGIFAVGIVLTVAWPPVSYRHWGFEVRPSDVFLSHGVLWRTASVVPHARIQHVDTQQGPIDRSFGLSAVVMFTAGTVGAALTIPGLAVADAEELREKLARLSGSDDAV